MYKVLIADDEAIERDALKYIIENSKLPIEEIKEAVNGQEAVSLAAVFEPDIAIMDIKMPGLDGIESSKIIKKIKSGTKIIFQTAFDELDHAKAGIELGVEAFIVKPASKERLITVIEDAINVIELERLQEARQNEMADKLKQVSKYLEEEFLASVVSGELSETQLKEYGEFMNLKGSFGFGTVLILNYDSDVYGSELRKQMMKKRVMEKLRESVMPLRRPCIMGHKKELIQLLVLEDTAEEAYKHQENIKEIIVTLGEMIQREYQLHIDCGIGDVKEGLANLWQSFAVARRSCRKKLNTQQEGVEDILLTRLVRCMSDGETQAVKDEVNCLMDKMEARSEDMDALKASLYEFTVLLNRTIKESASVKISTSDELFRDIMAIKTFASARGFLKEYLHRSQDQLRDQKTDKTMVVVDKLITYINNHYSENITLDQLGEISGFSTFYLSKVFKKHLDMNFSDYLVSIRIKVAKRLLKNPQKSVKEISTEVGYPDPNYFSRVFRKAEKMTPTEYRNRHLTL